MLGRALAEERALDIEKRPDGVVYATTAPSVAVGAGAGAGAAAAGVPVGGVPYGA